MNTWITADCHFGHANIIKYCKRPFKDLEEMNAILIKNWNERVSPGDIVIVLGDFAWESSFDKIKERYEITWAQPVCPGGQNRLQLA